MTSNKRIALNILATYGRSLYALIIGLFCGRWTLMALGEVDYGLYGVVGGLTAFITFLNGVMAGGVGRFYALSVGRSQKDPVGGLDECHKWFTTGVLVHSVLPLILMGIGYPLGEWAVRCFLTIPADRITACLWVWRCVCVSTLVSMVSVPFSAWYSAKQEIAELTIYSFVTTTLNVLFMYYAVHHPGAWLVPLAVWAMILSVIPQLIICCRAGIKYSECKFVWKYLAGSWTRIKDMLSYSGWVLIGTLADLFSQQGINVVINKFFGPRVNAAQAIGTTLSSQCQTLSGSLIGAFWPVITTAFGAGDLESVRRYAYRVSRMATVLVLIFALPLALEVDEVLLLWLKNPPQATAGLCLCALAYAVIDKTSFGYAIAVHATGRMAAYQLGVGGVFMLALPVAVLVVWSGGGIYAVALSVVALRIGVVVGRVLLARRVVTISVRYYLTKIIFPLAGIVIFSSLIGLLPRLFLSASFGRVCVTTMCVEIVLLPLTWFLLFDQDERSFIGEKFLSKIPLVKGVLKW